uniref:Polysaccharide biosynthesis enzyme WcbI domain-containing protein n=1 Tax=viral metagenome TaxID=1070528 RepID=A0A6C0J621_9ZZZZ
MKLKFIKNADILIYQPLNEKHKKFSTNNILKLIKTTCKTISFPYIYNNSFYPIKGPTEINQSHFGKHCHIIFDNSECITNLIDKKLNLDEILKLYQENKINFNYEKRYNNTINILENREKVCDIKIIDFIKKNFTKERLFLLENHPTSIIFINITNQILKILNIKELKILEYGINDCNLSGYIPLDISSKNYFNYEFEIDKDCDNYYKQCIINIFNFYTQN